MKKVAYFSYPHFADCDLPLLQQLRKEVDLTYVLCLSANTRQATLINVGKLKPRGGVYPISEYPDLQNIYPYVNPEKSFVLNMPGHHDWSPNNVLAILSLVVFLLRKHVEILHFTWPLRYGSFPLYLLHRRMILTMHDPLPHSSDENLLNRFHRWVAFRMVSRFIILNQSQREPFINTYHLQKRQVYLSRLGIYTHLQQTRPILPESKDYVLFTGSINPHKGIEYLCEAMTLLQDKHSTLQLIIAGKGRFYFDKTSYEQAGFVKIINRYITDEELAGLIKNAAFLVCPYIDATQSGVIMSAFALNCPVIATRVGGLPEMVEDGRHGLLVPPRDPSALASAIETLISSSTLLQGMRANIAKDYGNGALSWEAISKGIVEIYTNQL
ncbi:MAG: glycosyltransferase family 4 protein [Prevotella sp.]|nr:glycosyltransferase family 4 protein [Prevotella sp.]